jgi:predicted  nucleic acid-binding Zn-ribbon protein
MGNLDKLWEYQEAELALDKLESDIKSTPARVRLNKLHSFLSKQQGILSRTEKEIEAHKAVVDKLTEQFDGLERQCELELAEFDTMENDPECTAEEIKESRREFESLLEQVTSSRRELYETIMWLEKAKDDLGETWSKAGKAKKEYDETRAVCEKEVEESKELREKAKAEIKSREMNIPPELVARYKQVKLNHAVPMARVENNQCSGCNMSLPTSVIKKISTSNDLVECENCGRILYS